jgi:hypothetical protein
MRLRVLTYCVERAGCLLATRLIGPAASRGNAGGKQGKRKQSLGSPAAL